LQANIHKEIISILKKYWGHESFRPLQKEIILSVIEQKDTLALLPTGGGKSICFQVPALVLGGTCLVISPLIALMNDQVQNIKKRGISAVAITSAMSQKEIDISLNNAALGHVQFIYVSPERLQNENFQKKLSFLPITLIAVDEAHCVSQWGYDFRPSYLNIAQIKNYFDKVSIIALTASATKFVVEDIQQKLEFKNQQIFRQSFSRKNLRYVVQEEDDKLKRLFKIIQNIGGSGIIYVRNRKMTEDLAKLLQQSKLTAAAYHAGLQFTTRQTIQQNWINNSIQIVCATNAFGMGIDKPDVRFVVHLDLPDSLEAYFQEAGRAGRDGQTAYSTILFNKQDQQKLMDNFNLSYPSLDVIKHYYNAICNYYQIAVNSGAGTVVDFQIEAICKSYNLQSIILFNCIKFLEKENYLSFIDTGYEPAKVMFVANKDDVYNFQLKFPKFEPIIKGLLRTYGGIFENYVHIQEKDLSYKIKQPVSAVLEQLDLLDKQKLLSFIPQTSIPKLVFVNNRVSSNFLHFDEKNYSLLKQNHLNRINSVIDYTNNKNICRNTQLLIYFNEFDYQDCNYCDVCISKKPKDFVSVKQAILKQLQKDPTTLPLLLDGLKKYNSKTVIQAFNELMDDGKLAQNENIYYLKTK
jgi:ATP-dependent DNA helicase RecQ